MRSNQALIEDTADKPPTDDRTVPAIRFSAETERL
jgi:hypothetical protein